MRVVISAGGRFHALHLAHQLEKRNALVRLYTTAYTNDDKKYVSSDKVQLYQFGKFIDWIFEKLRFSKLISLSSWYVFKDRLFDRWVGFKVSKEEPFDLFIGWAHYFLESLPEVRKKGSIVVLETGSMHILAQQAILKEEYERFGQPFAPIDPRNVEKIVAEYKAADYILVPSSHVVESFIQQGISASKLRMVPYGVNLTRFSPAEKKPEKFTILFVGQVSLQKGVQYLLQAFKAACLSNAKLVIVGQLNVDFQTIYKQYKNDPTIIFYGAVSQEQLVKMYQTASVFVLPSLQEGFGMVLLEALSCRVPLICTDHTAGPLLIENNDCGFVVPIRDVGALTAKLLFLYNNPEVAEQMGKRGASKMKNFSWDVYGEKIFNVYQALLRSR